MSVLMVNKSSSFLFMSHVSQTIFLKLMKMKKQILLLCGLLAMTTMVHGQFEIKAFGGTNFAQLSKHPTDTDWKAKAGYQFGAAVLIGDKFYVEPGIQFVRSSREVTTETVDQIDFSQNYLKIPVYAGYHLLGHESGPLALRLFAGPAVSIAGKIKKGEDQISKDDIKNAHFLLDAGIGVDVFFLFVEANYEFALTDYFADETHGSKHSAFIINAGIHIDF